MNRFERFTPRHTGRGPNGRRLCVWCGTEVPAGRRRWCSQDCVRQMQIQHWPASWTQAVLDRDKGICQICGFDSRLLQRIIWRLGETYRRMPIDPWSQHVDEYQERMDELAFVNRVRKTIERHLHSQGFKPGSEWVEADHIVPIVEGGANTLENGRTLCVPCHKAETAKLARRRKWKRREAGTLLAKLNPEQETT